MVFCISAAFCAVGLIVYLAFASDEVQPWAKTEVHGEEERNEENSTAVEENNLLAVGNEVGEKA